MFGREENPPKSASPRCNTYARRYFSFLAYGLWRLQVSQSDYYSAAAERNRVREVPILAPRGKFSIAMAADSRELPLIYSAADAGLFARSGSRRAIHRAGLHMDPKEVREKIRHFASCPSTSLFTSKKTSRLDEEAFIESHKSELPRARNASWPPSPVSEGASWRMS